MTARTLMRSHGDTLLGIAVAGLYATEMLRWQDGDARGLLPFAFCAGLGLALRRRLPLVAFLLAASSIWGVAFLAPGLDNDSAALVIVFFVSLYSLGRYATGPQMWLGAAGVLMSLVVFVIGDSQGRPIDSGALGFATFFVGTPWAAGVAIRLRQERERVLTVRNEELQRDQEARARAAVAAERGRLARELHDVVSHAIAVTVLQARGGRKMLGVDDAEVRRCLDAIEHTNTQALSDMRRLLALLRDTEDADGGPPQGDPQPSLARLDALAAQVRASGLPVEVTVQGTRGDVPPGVDLSAYRIVQEALTNTLKHAGPGARAEVHVTYGTDDLDIRVSDDGSAPHHRAGEGHGLVGIHERVAVVGGEVVAGPASGGGFVVHARLPYAVRS